MKEKMIESNEINNAQKVLVTIVPTLVILGNIILKIRF